MLRHMGLAVVALSLVALTSESVHARGGGRSGHSRSYNFGNSGYWQGSGYDNSSAGTGFSSRSRSSSRIAKASGRGNGLASGQNGTAASATTTSVTTKTTRTITGPSTPTTSAQQTAAQTNTTPTKASVGSVQSPTQSAVTVSPFAISPYAIPLDPNTAAQNTYRAMLHNAKELIKAGIYGPATTYLHRIISGAPGTRIANEAQRLLASLPTF